MSFVCTWCKEMKEGEDFKDEISIKEFKISGFCQECQDQVFDEVV